jgi:CDP-diacylglycerol---serine O-phosphatidyltransferase
MTDQPAPQPSSQAQKRRKPFKGLPFNKMIPNIITLLALCAGMTAIKFGLQGRWELAAFAIVAAAILDTLDGRVARFLKGASKFGAELDSLSDFISFGVAPGMMLYLWALQDSGRFGWILALVFAACMALRLARFNTLLDDPDAPPWQANFFTGTPAPAGAGLALLPMVVSFLIGDDIVRRPEVVSVVMIVTSALLVCRVPTFSFKRMKVPGPWVMPTLVMFVVLLAASFSAPWATLTGVLVAYIVSMPISIRKHAQLTKEWEAQQGDSAGSD